ncbi:MAG TPA: tetratricopeptide repeat protein [Pyrinomonadaceae bacterium]|nr:tetratricopeptide repeat protein [Pyrinomonadaceae bacterium]
MLSRLYRHVFVSAFTLALLVCFAPAVAAQGDELSDDEGDPVKLFNQGQDAHAKKDYELALEFYEQAVKLRPEFPEAEYQKGAALAALKRLPEAERAYRRAMELRPDWPYPPAALGVLLARAEGREKEAEQVLLRALELDRRSLTSLVALAEVRTRLEDLRGAVELWQRVTAEKGDDASLWLARSAVEHRAKDTAAALKSLDRALDLEPNHAEARMRRAELLLETGETARAAEDARALEAAAKTNAQAVLVAANIYGRAGLFDEARRVYDSLSEASKNSDEGRKLREALNARCEDSPESREALSKLVEREPRNAAAHACLGSLLRRSDPPRSLELYKRAVEVEPRNVEYATGYAAALLQLRKFAEAATILERILRVAPDNYAAHANMAAALYELKLYKQAIVEYKWINEARPELAVVHFFIATAHDRLGEYEDALAAYETFIRRADPQANGLEIEKVNLRLPSLRRQIKQGEGVKRGKKSP